VATGKTCRHVAHTSPVVLPPLNSTCLYAVPAHAISNKIVIVFHCIPNKIVSRVPHHVGLQPLALDPWLEVVRLEVVRLEVVRLEVVRLEVVRLEVVRLEEAPDLCWDKQIANVQKIKVLTTYPVFISTSLLVTLHQQDRKSSKN